MAQPADGSEIHLKDKPIQKQNLNLDNDEDILKATDRSGGKWRFYMDGKLIAESPDPGEVNASIVGQWADAVRKRCKRTLTQEDIDRKLEAKKEKQSSGGIILPDGVDVTDADSPADSDIQDDAPVGTLDDDPDSYVNNKISAAEKRVKAIKVKRIEMEELYQDLDREETAAAAELAKWTRMKEVINED